MRLLSAVRKDEKYAGEPYRKKRKGEKEAKGEVRKIRSDGGA